MKLYSDLAAYVAESTLGHAPELVSQILREHNVANLILFEDEDTLIFPIPSQQFQGRRVMPDMPKGAYYVCQIESEQMSAHEIHVNGDGTSSVFLWFQGFVYVLPGYVIDGSTAHKWGLGHFWTAADIRYYTRLYEAKIHMVCAIAKNLGRKGHNLKSLREGIVYHLGAGITAVSKMAMHLGTMTPAIFLHLDTWKSDRDAMWIAANKVRRTVDQAYFLANDLGRNGNSTPRLRQAIIDALTCGTDSALHKGLQLGADVLALATSAASPGSAGR